MTNVISATEQQKCDNIVQNKADESVTSFRDFTFLQFIMANCIWRVCVHDSGNPYDAIRGLSKTKGSKLMGATLGVSVLCENLSLPANGTDKQKRFLPLFSRVSWCSKVR